jgi:hypothetical protein
MGNQPDQQHVVGRGRRRGGGDELGVDGVADPVVVDVDHQRLGGLVEDVDAVVALSVPRWA